MGWFFSKNSERSLDPQQIIREIEDARRKQFEKSLPKEVTYEDAKAKLVSELGAFLHFLTKYVEYLVSSEAAIKGEISNAKARTRQNILEELFLRELWGLRYVMALLWFLELDKPKNQNELEVNILLTQKAFKDVLEKAAKPDYLPWLEQSASEYLGSTKLSFGDLKKVRARFSEKLAEKVPRIAFDATEGRLGGDLFDSLVELIKSTVEQDQRSFRLVA
jgi:hypothetical protein